MPNRPTDLGGDLDVLYLAACLTGLFIGHSAAGAAGRVQGSGQQTTKENKQKRPGNTTNQATKQKLQNKKKQPGKRG